MVMKNNLYTDDRAAQIMLSLLKQYGIRKIVISPGTTNVPISLAAQNDPFFEAYSVVDERSAGYFATGLAFESGEPVVISCTGATASVNYLPALTEAYYRNLPIIALTSQNPNPDPDNFTPQHVDRTVLPNDTKHVSVHIPVIKDDADVRTAEVLINKALISVTEIDHGPVHINLLKTNLEFSTPELPKAQKIEYYSQTNVGKLDSLKNELIAKKIVIYVGSHLPFSKELNVAIKKFVETYDAAVFVDNQSNCHTGKEISLSQYIYLLGKNPNPDVVIDMGWNSGNYNNYPFIGREVWRLSVDGKIHDRFGSVKKLINSTEEFFFSRLTQESIKKYPKMNYYKSLLKELRSIKVPRLPLSTISTAESLVKNIPKNSSLHIGRGNISRSVNFFVVDKSIRVDCNSGVSGIDGAVSTMVGQSMIYRNKLTFGIIGDLTFFYDMNILGNRHINNSLRILLVNNGLGVEFRVNPKLELLGGDSINNFVAAKGHNGSAKAWAESMGFKYLSATTKKEMNEKMPVFCAPNINQFDAPVFFEVFTEADSEK
jgi:2-succinyl-5-enolpyruvyl-6-hydroxy-3-cyclohexene-1-carboxylate synthase